MYAIAVEKDGRLDYVYAILYDSLEDARRAVVLMTRAAVVVSVERVP